MESDQTERKRAVAERAAALVEQGMAVGLGTGSTAALLIEALIRRVREEDLHFVAVPTSERTADQASAGGILLTDLGAHPQLDLAIDGADQIAEGSLALIKGYGGALLREKIVAAAAKHFVVIADDSKLSPGLDKKVPVEVVRFGWQSTDRQIRALGAETELRKAADGSPYLTDGGNYILDAALGPLPDPAATNQALRAIVGVVETGLFIAMADTALLATADGVVTLTRT